MAIDSQKCLYANILSTCTKRKFLNNKKIADCSNNIVVTRCRSISNHNCQLCLCFLFCLENMCVYPYIPTIDSNSEQFSQMRWREGHMCTATGQLVNVNVHVYLMGLEVCLCLIILCVIAHVSISRTCVLMLQLLICASGILCVISGSLHLSGLSLEVLVLVYTSKFTEQQKQN